MGERIVTIKLIAEATGMVQGFNRAKDAVAETKTKVEESARSSREEWSKVGAGLTAVGVAITGVGVAALKTGIQYNTLQQTSRAALTSLLGSAQAANAQMDKLDDFARNSPFSKATFITAQQQMLAFGIEARKVIPYLDGIQNAVAAAGGSNADIEGIVATMSKIQSSSKITATDLMEFGNRGVNAAELIGSQMGKTGAQIREDITAGSLSAEDALDALAKGMTETYNGAADNVKNTFAGSLDRVKAAWRDFSSELAKPLVDPNGGGALVDLLNWTADAMRNFEKLPEPVKATVSALTGLVGVGSLVAGTAILALPKWVAFKDALATFSPAAAGARGGLMNIVRFLGGPWGIAMLGAAATVAVFNKAMDASQVSASRMETSIKQGSSALEVMSEQAAKNEQGLTRLFVDIGSQVENLGPLLDKAANSGRGFFSSLTFNEQGMLENLSELGVVLSNIATDDLPRAQTEFARFAQEADLSTDQLKTALNEMPGFKDQLIEYAEGAQLATDDSTLLALALGKIQAERPKNELEELAGVAVDTTDAVSQLAEEIRNFGSAQIDADRAAIDLQDKIRALSEIMAVGAGSLDIYSEAGGKTQSALLDVAEGAREQAAAILLANGSQEEANAVLESARQHLINQRIALGEDAAAAEAWAALRVPTAQQVQQALDNVKNSAEAIPPNSNANVSTNADEAAGKVDNLITRLRSIPSPVDVQVRTFESLVYSQKGLDAKYGNAYGGTVGYAAGGTIGGIGGYVSGGTVFGRGGTKSDSVLVRLSRGEEVVQEPYASMYRRELKQMNRGDFAPSSMAQQPIIVVPQTQAAPLIGGNVQFVSSGNLHSDVGTVMHELRKRQRGGKYVGSR